MERIDYVDHTSIYVKKVYKNKRIEKEEVLKPCLNLCKILFIQGVIKQYRRLDVKDYHHIDGSPDIEIWLVKNNTLYLLLAECKKPIGGIQNKNQIKYEKMFIGLVNVVYVLIKSKEQLYQEIEKIIGNQLDKIDFNPPADKTNGEIVN